MYPIGLVQRIKPGICRLVVLFCCGLPAGVFAAEQHTYGQITTLVNGALEHSVVQGVSIAVIDGGEISWQGHFGVANSLTREPLTADTVFQAASISKAVAAFGFLTLVDSGQYSLDEPLPSSLLQHWVTEPAGDVPITPRHLLSHSSGLGNNVRGDDRRQYFEAGSCFQYSGVGFLLLQDLLETSQAKPADQIMQDHVFAPLGMNRSSFLLPPGAEISAGHMPLKAIQAFLLVPAIVLSLMLLILCLGVRRYLIKGLSPWGCGVLSALLTALTITVFATTSVSAAMGVTIGVLLSAHFILLLGLAWLINKSFLRTALLSCISEFIPATLSVLAAVLVLLGLSVTLNRAPVPVPGAPADSLAWSLHTTAEDLARFTIAATKTVASPGVLGQFLVPQIATGSGARWGLGIGLVDTPQGRIFYHMGSNPGFRALMVGVPEESRGVVVLTNGGDGLILAKELVNLILGGGIGLEKHLEIAN